MPELETVVTQSQEVRAAAERGDFERVAALAEALAPGTSAQLVQFRYSMEAFSKAKAESDWRRALRALADARLAAIAAGLTELEDMVTGHLFEVIRHYEGRRSEW